MSAGAGLYTGDVCREAGPPCRCKPNPTNTGQYLPEFRVRQQGKTSIARPANRALRRILELFSTMRRETRKNTTRPLMHCHGEITLVAVETLEAQPSFYFFHRRTRTGPAYQLSFAR
jgi:hypothetical protein